MRRSSKPSASSLGSVDMSKGVIPFPALVGLDQAQHALMLLAVDPLLGGVVLGAGAGTGKSSLMRGFAELVVGLPHCAHLVEVPLGVTEDRLLGGLDLEATLATGTRHYRAGLLARADGGLLYVDNINLLDDSSLNHLLATLDTGMVRVEREGLSQRSPARLVLLATYDPAEAHRAATCSTAWASLLRRSPARLSTPAPKQCAAISSSITPRGTKKASPYGY